jgi:hypothetical protein
MWTPFDSFVAVQEAAAKIPQPPRPDHFWRAIFLDQERDWSVVPYDKRPKPVDLMPRPPFFKDRPIGVDDKIYLRSVKVSKETEEENERIWRELVLKHGEGTYNFYDTFDEAGEHPIALFGWWSVIFICGEDYEKIRLGIGAEPLSDARVEELRASLNADIILGDASGAEALALELERRGLLEEALAVSDKGRKAPDHDKGIWDEYREEKVSARNIQRRLLKITNRVFQRLHPKHRAGGLESLVDTGEADPKRECEKCGKKGALPAECVIGAVRLCYGCRRLPKSEWPNPKPIPSFFQSFTPLKPDGSKA